MSVLGGTCLVHMAAHMELCAFRWKGEVGLRLLTGYCVYLDEAKREHSVVLIGEAAVHECKMQYDVARTAAHRPCTMMRPTRRRRTPQWSYSCIRCTRSRCCSCGATRLACQRQAQTVRPPAQLRIRQRGHVSPVMRKVS